MPLLPILYATEAVCFPSVLMYIGEYMSAYVQPCLEETFCGLASTPSSITAVIT